MKQQMHIPSTKALENLTVNIIEANSFFLNTAQKQVNTALTLRNWLIGFYIVEYEQSGRDRAKYGKKLYKLIAEKLAGRGLKSIRERHLYLCKDLYKSYPQILGTLSAKSYLAGFSYAKILLTVSAESLPEKESQPDINSLVTNLSFSHFIELLKTDSEIKKRFYEWQALKNNWSIRELKRAIESQLYERTGLSKDKELVIEKFNKEHEQKPEQVFRNTYLLEFLGFEERDIYSESDLEERIITNLQNFLLELGRGFCFEARQRRITFGNTHYRIDLVFYHRILKCMCC